jgi:hypothetical protein
MDWNLNRRISEIQVPKKGNCDIILKIKCTCDWCCNDIDDKPTNRRRIITITIKDFNYSNYESKSLDQKRKYLEQYFFVNFNDLPGTEAFNTGNPSCYCTPC